MNFFQEGQAGTLAHKFCAFWCSVFIEMNIFIMNLIEYGMWFLCVFYVLFVRVCVRACKYTQKSWLLFRTIEQQQPAENHETLVLRHWIGANHMTLLFFWKIFYRFDWLIDWWIDWLTERLGVRIQAVTVRSRKIK